jgi:orotidine 5'-phosphate decarboxylase subfamily 1
MKLFIALDKPVLGENFLMASRLNDVVGAFGYKLNLDLLLKYGIQRVHDEFSHFARELFFDFKMFNGGRTMASIAQEAVDLGVEYINVHALSDYGLDSVVKVTRDSPTLVLAVTILTHFDEEYYKTNFVNNIVRKLVLKGVASGCDGVIVPEWVLPTIADVNILKVVPGIRPHWYTDKRHASYTSPLKAKEGGASIIVCGSPISKHHDPVHALNMILEEMEKKK